MVGLVVVCHSRALARAAVALAAEMVHGEPAPIEVAAGLDETTFGTDAVAIADAVAAADRGDGVVVLMDLGSAVLSAELALELLEEDLRDRVVLCPAPLVEGLVAAAVTAASGAGRREVSDEATAAMAGKQSHLAPAAGVEPASGGGIGTGPSATFTVTNPHGLHARPAARLVAQVAGYDAEVEIRNRGTGSPWVSASSLSRVATLGALHGHELEVRASGAQAREAVDRVVALAARAFDEADAGEPAADARAEAGAGNGFVAEVGGFGRPASPGIAIGPARHPHASAPTIPDVASQGAAAEWDRIEDALATARRDLRRVRADTAREAGDAHAAIFDAHLLLLGDADLLADVRSRLGGGAPAPQAWSAATDRIAAEFGALADPYLSAREADVRAVAAQVLRALLGDSAGAPPGFGVLIAPDLTPAEAAGLDTARVAGVLLAYGSPTSHGAILARARGVPTVVGLGARVLEVPDGTPVALDGGTGEVVVAPLGPVLATFRRRAAEQASRRERARARAGSPAMTRDGVPVAVGANVGSPADARAAADHGADLAGLVRTEFLFLGRDAAPDAGEQLAAYREIADALGGRRITVRTLDVGGDKPLRYVPAAAEDNPFLGVRGIRHSLEHPELLREQLLAIVRLAREVPVSVMFPMVSTVPEVLRARRMLDEALARAGGGTPSGLRVGMMMEVPAAALKTAAFAPHVDFVSIGTNDLAQYALAAERGNAALAGLSDGTDPGVLRLIDAVCRGAGGRVPVAVCGELAGDEAAVPLLIGLGVRELSVAPRSVPGVKEAVRATVLAEAAAAAARALDLADAAAVRDLLAADGRG
ncbi:phosphoenolpyruvate--protein phosphotransferase [Actinoplanes sp. NPDC049118]|uniref:phosphoenolpyruvate--protein phosphotransferase n=1 Tax=Actinoplanes sp. NPDC049118 TaxID=3155769 RepID=UPI0034109B2F